MVIRSHVLLRSFWRWRTYIAVRNIWDFGLDSDLQQQITHLRDFGGYYSAIID